MRFWQHFKIVYIPPRTFFTGVKKETLAEPLLFYLALTLLGTVLSVFNPTLRALFSSLHPSVLYLLLLIASFIGLFLITGIYHKLLRFFHGKGSYADTVKSYVYGSVPGVLWGILSSGILLLVPRILSLFLPFTLAAWAYSIYLTLQGFSYLHKVSLGKAALVYFLPLIALGIIVLALLLYSLLAVLPWGML